MSCFGLYYKLVYICAIFVIMKKENFSEKDSVEVISKMLQRTQHQVNDNGFIYLLWGWLVFVAALTHYIPFIFWDNSIGGLAWVILMPLGGIITGIYTHRQAKEQKVVQWADEALKNTSIAFGAGLLFTLTLGPLFTDWRITYAFLLLVYGMWLFISGGILRFTPLKIGGIINWIMGAVCFMVPEPHELGVLAVAVLLGYIIPGHLLRKRFLNA